MNNLRVEKITLPKKEVKQEEITSIVNPIVTKEETKVDDMNKISPLVSLLKGEPGYEGDYKEEQDKKEKGDYEPGYAEKDNADDDDEDDDDNMEECSHCKGKGKIKKEKETVKDETKKETSSKIVVSKTVTNKPDFHALFNLPRPEAFLPKAAPVVEALKDFFKSK